MTAGHCPTCPCRIRTLNGLYCQRLKRLVEWHGQRPKDCIAWEQALTKRPTKHNNNHTPQ